MTSPSVISRVVLAGLLLGAIFAGVATTVWRNSSTAVVRRAQAVYICRETGDLFVGRGETAPQIHPRSGRATLWPAVYCPGCKGWTAAPPAERLSGHVELLKCPKCRETRSFQGVIPDGATEF